jgi:hypothetical protein
MIGLLLSVVAFVAAFVAGRIGLGLGMFAVATVGYFYGILRANYYDGFSHFLFDAACFGLYLAQAETMLTLLRRRPGHPLVVGFKVLFIWPFCVLALFFLFPQSPLIQFVGLRAAVWFLPFLLLGGAATERDLNTLARGLALLNLAALAFALAEYHWGVERFFPKNPTTELIYKSRDVAGFTAYRIPGTFSSAAAYGGTMVASLPWLFGRWVQRSTPLLEKGLMLSSMTAAVLGVFLCGARSPVILMFVLVGYMVLQLRSHLPALLLVLATGGAIAYVVSSDERMQRFTTLEDTERVVRRIHGSANVGILEVVVSYPLGNGLGGATGTSIPAFLMDAQSKFRQIGGENEYCRIALELGLIGLFFWIGFLVVILSRRAWGPSREWDVGARVVWLYSAVSWGTALIGTGTLTSIPSTLLLLLGMGVASAPYRAAPREPLPGNLLGYPEVGTMRPTRRHLEKAPIP